MNDYKRIEKVIHYLHHNYQDQPPLDRLAKVAGLSEFHFHRLFSRWAGTTPKSFLKALTAEHAKRLLRESKDLLNVSLDSGLSGPGRLHDLLISVEGMTPGQFKAQGAGLQIRYGFHETPFGRCLIGIALRGICFLAFGTTFDDLENKFPAASFLKDNRGTAKVVAEIFNQHRKKPLSVLTIGTPFQLKVWKALLRIPEGKVVSYGELAAALGSPGAARAVGSAVAKNSIGYLIPCHRVIRETGVLGDYRWGSDRKRVILAWEANRQVR